MIEKTVRHEQNLLFTRVPRETTSLLFDIFNKRKRHIDENNERLCKGPLIIGFVHRRTSYKVLFLPLRPVSRTSRKFL